MLVLTLLNLTNMPKTIQYKQDFPKVEHYAVIVFDTMYIADDGYGDSSTIPTTTYKSFESKDEWEAWVKGAAVSNTKFLPIFVKPAQITITTTVTLDY